MMQNPNTLEPFIPAIESFLKELQDISVIKEYSLQTSELNSSNFNEFRAVFLKFTEKINDSLVIHETPVKCLNISEAHINSDQDQPVQTEETKIDSKSMQQLQVDGTEIKRRINAFISRKRKEIDERNVQEFCGRPYIDEDNPLWEQIDSCARIDAVFIPRFGRKSHVKVSKVENRWGPQTQFQNEAPKKIKTEPGLVAEDETNNVTFEAIEERLRVMEEHLKLKSDSSTRNSIFQRLKRLEDRILFLEGLSPDYFNLSAPNYSSNKKSMSEKEKMYSTWSVDDVQKRIQVLTDSLKTKSTAMKPAQAML